MLILPKNDSDINGIIHKIRNINVTCVAKSYQQLSSVCWNAINISHDYHFCSGSGSSQWYQFTFPNTLIRATHYSIQSPTKTNSGWYMPKSWEFFGIKADGTTVSIDDVEESKLNEDKKIVVYKTNKVGVFTGFKLQMRGYNYQGSLYDLRLYKIDVFGTILPSFCKCTTRTSKIRCTFVFTALFIMSSV